MSATTTERSADLQTDQRPDHSGSGSGNGFWGTGAVCVALVALLPIMAIIWVAFSPTENIWPHLVSTTLPHYLLNTFVLMTGVGVSVFLTGVSTAWLVSAWSFPGARIFEWMLLLPLAVPAYVIAYLYTDLLEFAGPVQGALRGIFGWELARDYWFPNVRSMGGAIMVMGLALYPYVYLMARSSFLEQSPHLFDACRLMGRSRFNTFLFVSLPIARPGIAIGTALALMETLNDFGTVDYFAVHALTAGLFDVWLNMNNLGGAAQIALVMLTFVLILLALEHAGRSKIRFYQNTGRFTRREKIPLRGASGWIAFALCFLPILAGFLVPCAMLVGYGIRYFDQSWSGGFHEHAFNSLTVASIAAVGCAAISILIVYSRRIITPAWFTSISKVSSLGYAVPGSVLAVGIVISLTTLENWIDGFFRLHFGFSTGLILTGTIFALILTYMIRFLAISTGSIESSFSKVPGSIDMAARTLGHPPLRTLRLFHIPLIKSGILTAMLIVFVDCMKELPATLLLRPFNFETLATHVYLFASDEMIEYGALSALMIVLTGLIPVIVLSKTISYSQLLKQKAD